MKKSCLVSGLVSVALIASALADIQDPPSNDYGPTRKLGRGLGNFLFGGAEIPATICKVSNEEGNVAGASYGVVRGVGRAVARHVTGLIEMLLCPARTCRGGWLAMLPHRI